MGRFIDPPEGWRYGFPKEIPIEVDMKDINEWMIENGYPEKEMKKYGDRFYYRFWTTDYEIDE